MTGMTGADPRTSLRELAGLFLRLGTTAFGGPAVHIAMMEEQVVRRRGWLTHEEFLDRLGATHLIPGPNSTELAIHIGHSRRGWAGLVVAGACFIAPAALIVSAIAWAYVRYGALPAVEGVLAGIKPVVVAIVVNALWELGRRAARTRWLAAVGIGALAAALLGLDELVVLALAGALCGAVARGRAARGSGGAAASWIPWPLLAASASGAGGAATASVATAGAATAGAATAFGLWPLFLVFLKIGSVLFGSGYVLVAFLRTDLVEGLRWLTEPQLLDAVAVGQVTPGPVFTTATFIGYLLGGPAGAAVATVAIFLPAFVLVAISGPLIPRLRRSITAGGVLDGVNVASLALMAAAALQLGRGAIVDPVTAALALAAAVLSIRYRVNSGWLVLGGAAAGALVAWVA